MTEIHQEIGAEDADYDHNDRDDLDWLAPGFVAIGTAAIFVIGLGVFYAIDQFALKTSDQRNIAAASAPAHNANAKTATARARLSALPTADLNHVDAEPTDDPGPLAGTWKDMTTKKFITFEPGRLLVTDHPLGRKTGQNNIANDEEATVSYQQNKAIVTVVETAPRAKDPSGAASTTLYDLHTKNVARDGHNILLRVFN